MDKLKTGVRFILAAALGINVYVFSCGIVMEDYSLMALGGLSGVLCAYSLFWKR